MITILFITPSLNKTKINLLLLKKSPISDEELIPNLFQGTIMHSLFALLDAVNIPSAALSGGNQILYLNQEFSQVFGYTINFNDEAPELNPIRESLFKEASNRSLTKHPIEISSIDGEAISVLPRSFYFPELGNICVILMPLTSPPSTSLATFNNSLQESRLVAVEQMASGFAHEINNPMTVVLSKVCLVEKILQSPEFTSQQHSKILDSLAKAKSSIYRIITIIKGLRNLARNSENDDRERYDLNEIVREALELNAERLKEKGILVKVELSAPGSYSLVRPYQICQILINLINNAVDAIDATPLGQINISTQNLEGEILLRVSDNGPGVPIENEHKLMAPFFTTKEVGVGTGLGLSICRRIAHSHHGRFEWNKKVSRSCFELYLPSSEGSPK